MLSTFELPKLDATLRDFHTLTGLRITVFDAELREITSHPRALAPICRYIRTDPEAEAACHACDRRACEQSLALHEPYIHHCHAGLIDAVTPVYLNDTAVAYLSFGHLFSYESREAGEREIRKRCSAYALDAQRIADLTSTLPMTDRGYILSAARIMKVVASYLCAERMIAPEQYSLDRELDAYINAHFTEDISGSVLTGRFGIGRTALYAFAARCYGCGIATHIRRLRIEHAEQLLLHTDAPISEIAERSGFHDYSYFITVFTRLKGCPPGQLRRRHTESEIP